MTDPMELVGRLESSAPLPICPYDRRSPDYWTTNDTDPCKFCGSKNEEGAPDLCRGADTRLFTEAAACIREMVEQRARLYDSVSNGFYDGFRDAINRSPWPDCYDYAAAKSADYAKSAMARIIAQQAADPSRRLNPLPPAPGAEA